LQGDPGGHLMRLLFLLLFAGLVYSAPCAAEGRRVAFVVGNSAYLNAAVLANPVNDATEVASSLERLGFEVVLGLDLDHRSFVAHMKDYARRLQGADLALFFYAGHGLQVKGRNYLAPVNTKLVDEIDLEFETVRLDAIIAQMEKEPRTSLIFLDACRNNPLARNLAGSLGTRDVGSDRGLAPVETGIGTLIAYATQPGNVAYDGAGRHSPFTTALLEHMETPGADIAMVLRRVRQQVLTETNGKQVPWSNSSLTGEVVLKTGLREDLLEFKRLEEEAFWSSVKDSSDPVVLENYLKRFPEGAHTEDARRKIEDLARMRLQEQDRIARLQSRAEQQAESLLAAEREKELLLRRLQAGTADHQARLEAAREKVAERELELEQLAHQNRQLREKFDASVSALEKRLAQAEAEQALREKEVARLVAERAQLETEVQGQATMRQSLNEAMGEAEKSARETQDIRDELARIRSQSEREISDQTEELALARQEIAAARQQANDHSAELHRLQKERDDFVSQYTKKLEQAENEREELMKRLAALSKQAQGDAPGSPESASVDAGTTKSVRLDRSGRIALQMSLREFGFDPGPADGDFGPQTFQAIMDARLALNLPAGSHVDQDLIGLLPDVSKLFGAYDGDWIVIRTASNPKVCGWTQVRQRLQIQRGSITGPGYAGEVHSNGTMEMTRSFIQSHKRRQSLFEGRIGESGGLGSFGYDFNDCRGDFVLRKGSVVSLAEEDEYGLDTKDRTLVRSVQAELNRLGCDVGVADGVWGARSRQGLRQFARLNARQADSATGGKDLLSILRKQPDLYCDAPRQAAND
jgi:peptidoglycan hydrolase-like protein with peptidoglycan-binding domain